MTVVNDFIITGYVALARPIAKRKMEKNYSKKVESENTSISKEEEIESGEPSVDGERRTEKGNENQNSYIKQRDRPILDEK